MTEITPRGLARKIRKLPTRPPITASYERALVARGIWNADGVWYTSQQEHWLGWLSEYGGPSLTAVARVRSGSFATSWAECTVHQCPLSIQYRP
jgi:hypothetical protein